MSPPVCPQGNKTKDIPANDPRYNTNMDQSCVINPEGNSARGDQSQLHLENENVDQPPRTPKVASLSFQQHRPIRQEIPTDNPFFRQQAMYQDIPLDNPYFGPPRSVSTARMDEKEKPPTPKYPTLSLPNSRGAWTAVKEALSPTSQTAFTFPREELSSSYVSYGEPNPIFTTIARTNTAYSLQSSPALGTTCCTEISDISSGVVSTKEFQFYSPNLEAPPIKHEKNISKLPELEDEEERGHWGSRMEFVLSCVGYSVGLGNVWRFPFLAYENGGGAFLIPYVILLMFVGKPMYFMEAALGQFSQVGPLAVWMDMCRAGMGVGVAMVIISLMVAIYYNVIMAYTLVYLFNCFRSVLPWTVCDPAWGADSRCFVRDVNGSSLEDLNGACVLDEYGGCVEEQMQTSAEQFWEKGTLDINPSGLQTFGDIGEIKWNLAFCLLLSWLVVNVCLIKGVQSSGKVVYFTATFPYVVLLILLVRGCTLPGASNGLYYLFVPNWSKLADVNVWRAAASQVFFSLGISWGGIILFGSYNKFDAKVHIDAHIVSIVDFLTSLIASIVIFSTLGNTAYELGVPIEAVAKGGPGLAFVAFPEALSKLPCPHFWSIIFFSMLFLLGLDSEFALFETALSAIYDAVPSLRKQKMVVTSCMSLACFLLGLPCISQCGQYILNLMDTYGAGLSVLVIAIFEMIFIMWVYGTREFCKDIDAMLGFTPNIYFRLCWGLVSPVLLLGILLAGCWSWKVPSYGPVEYPPWAHHIGWVLAVISIGQIPLWAVVVLIESAVTTSWKDAIQPSQAWGEKRCGGSGKDSKFLGEDGFYGKQSRFQGEDGFSAAQKPGYENHEDQQYKYFPNFQNPFLNDVDKDETMVVKDCGHNHKNNQSCNSTLTSEYERLQKNLAVNCKLGGSEN